MKYFIILLSLISFSRLSAQEVDSLGESQNTEANSAADNAVEQITTPDSLWDGANTAYINGNYTKAIELYSSIEQQGLSSEVFYFNLGNAYYKSDDIARAILYYQKALLISPNDSDILYNLSIAQSQIKDQIEEIPELFIHRWSSAVSHLFSCTGWTILSIVALTLLLAALLLFLLSRPVALRKIGFGVGVAAAILFILSTSYALSERREILNHNQAVVMSQSISIKSSPDKSATDLFMLHSGTTVKIIREVDGWFEIAIADGKKGWIEERRVERI